MSVKDVVETLAEPINKLTIPVATSAGQTLQDIWDLVFGGFGTYVEKKRFARLQDFNSFKQSFENKVLQIPEECLCEPRLSVLGPALEASKFYFEEEDIREMFANLLAASVDSRKAEKIHPSFVEIIKQMSPLDAQNLSCFKAGKLPIAEYRRTEKSGFIVLLSNVFLSNSSEQDLSAQSKSISTLSYLGLINVDYLTHLTDNAFYAAFDKTSIYQIFCDSFGKDNVTVQHGLASITPIGKQFISICLP